jgi:hypothetical protein
MKRVFEIELDNYYTHNHDEGCSCGYHESNEDRNVSLRLIKERLENWKKEVENTLYVPDVGTSMKWFDYMFRVHIYTNQFTVFDHLMDWAQELEIKRKQHFKEAGYTLLLCLRRTPIAQYADLRRLVLQTYLRESGAHRFKKWMNFILGGLFANRDKVKKQKL